MSKPGSEKQLPFAEDFWRQDGGQKWVQFIDRTEATLRVFDEILLDRAGIAPGDIVLDVGCGGGLNSIEIAGRVGDQGRVVGIDISPDILAIADFRGRHIDNLEFIEGDAASMSLKAAAFSLIFSRFGMMFFSEPVRAFRNLRNAMKQGGRMIFLCWRTFEENPWMNEPAQAVFEIIPPSGPPPAPGMPGPFSLGRRDRIEYLLQGAGFPAVRIEALDISISLGRLDDAVDYFMQMGPAAVVIMDATETQKTAAREAIRNVLIKYQAGDRIEIPAAAWIVTAR